MRKTLYLLNIGHYEPEITKITYPSIERWADKIEAKVQIISERKFPEWPVTYEKLQICELAEDNDDDWSIYIDSDALIHPELPDVTEFIRPGFVAHNAVDLAGIRFRYDDYFKRDGRNIGSANWLAVAHRWCRDLWRPLDISPEEAIANIFVTPREAKFMKPEHLIDDYALSRNIAKYGLHVVTLNDIWKACDLQLAEFFYHQYLMDTDTKLAQMKDTLEKWEL